MTQHALPPEFDRFRKLSAALGQDPLRVQGPGGNTSIKDGGVMWIKASGTELAEALKQEIFVPVDHAGAIAEAMGETGDGSCQSTVLDPGNTLRPSIETTFHAVLPWQVVAHTHSIATLVHAVSEKGLRALSKKLAGLPFVIVPYAKPGLPLTAKIEAAVTPETKIIILANHGLIVCGESVAEVATLTEDVEGRLAMLSRPVTAPPVAEAAPAGFTWVSEGWMAVEEGICARVAGGSYYPDHVVFLGPALATDDHDRTAPALLIPGKGIAMRKSATASQQAMLRCLSDLFARLPDDWEPLPIGHAAEAELLNWDAEKYRQALAARS